MGRVEEGVRVVPVEIDQVEGVLALDLNIVLGSEGVRVLDVRGTDLLDGFFVLHNVVEDTLKVAAASARAASAGSGAFVEPASKMLERTPNCASCRSCSTTTEFQSSMSRATNRACGRCRGQRSAQCLAFETEFSQSV